tara:strand:- start:400 stop:1533 length:1134 start_codon:yes stop_codon:yes gene_type:complete
MSHLIEEYAKSLGVRISKPIVSDHFFPINLDKYITLTPDDDKPAKYYKHYGIVLELVKPQLSAAGFKILQLGGKQLIPGVDQAVQLPFKQSSYLLSGSSLHIGPDGVLSHVASAKNIPTVSLFGNVFPSVNRPFWGKRSENITLSPNWEVKPCFSLQDPKQEINNIKPEEIAKSIFKLLKINQSLNFKTQYVGANFGHDIIEVVPTVFSPAKPFEGRKLFIRVDYGYNEEAFLRYCQNYEVSIMSEKLIQPQGLNGKIKDFFVLMDASWSDIPETYFTTLKNKGINITLLTEKKEDLGILRNKYFDIAVRQHKANLEPRPANISSNSKFSCNKKLYEAGKTYFSYAHWKKGLDNNFNVIDTPEYWEELEHFYIYEQS